MGKAILSSCCCCFSLESAGKILAWLTIISSIMVIFDCGKNLISDDDDELKQFKHLGLKKSDLNEFKEGIRKLKEESDRYYANLNKLDGNSNEFGVNSNGLGGNMNEFGGENSSPLMTLQKYFKIANIVGLILDVFSLVAAVLMLFGISEV